jgi:hypothetical protein
MTTVGNVYDNMGQAISAADWLMTLGHAPYLPHLTLFWNLISNHTWEEWLQLDEKWLAVCDCLVRLPGESKGADREVAFCQKNNIPVYLGMEALMDVLEPDVPEVWT